LTQQNQMHMIHERAHVFQESWTISRTANYSHSWFILIKVCAIILCTSFDMQILIISACVCYSTPGSQLLGRSSANTGFNDSSREWRQWRWFFWKQERNLSYPEPRLTTPTQIRIQERQKDWVSLVAICSIALCFDPIDAVCWGII
jgi:hypothetical protein